MLEKMEGGCVHSHKRVTFFKKASPLHKCNHEVTLEPCGQGLGFRVITWIPCPFFLFSESCFHGGGELVLMNQVSTGVPNEFKAVLLPQRMARLC